MITIGNTQLRNLEEQVGYLSDKVLTLSEISSSLGIRVINVAADADDLPEDYEGEYGDAYLVGTEPPYTVYVWSRAFIDEEDTDHWQNIGPIQIIGPEGPKGDKGDTGEPGQGTKILFTQESDDYAPSSTIGFNIYDCICNTTNGNIWQLYSKSPMTWVLTGSIKGPQGVQGIQGIQGLQGEQGEKGEQGPQGDVGAFIHIVGAVASTAQLPNPSSLHDLSQAYLVGDSNILYIQVGETPDTAIWTNMGPLNVGTYVTAGGQFQGIWDSDTKLNKKTDDGTYVYTHIGSSQSHQAMSGNYDGNTVALRTNGGQLRCAFAENDYDCVNKAYLVATLSTKLGASKSAISTVGGLVTPNTTPTSQELVGINTLNSQTRVTIGEGLEISSQKLKCKYETWTFTLDDNTTVTKKVASWT